MTYPRELIERMIRSVEADMEEQRLYERLRKELGWVEDKLEKVEDKNEFDWRLTKIARELSETKEEK